MLVDNVVEITLHQLAKDKQSEAESWRYRHKPYEHVAALRAALGQHFESKVKFAKTLGKIDSDTSQSLTTFHSFRNEVYHIGIQHEAVLPAIAPFHFRIACAFLEGYAPSSITYGLKQTLPKRAQKYFKGSNGSASIPQYHAACASLSGSIAFEPKAMAQSLASHVDEIIDQQDIAIHMVATAGPRKMSRDDAVADTFAWQLAFTEGAKTFAQQHGWSKGSVLDYVLWVRDHYPLPAKHDPILAWRRRSGSIRTDANPHKALKKYRDFMTQTADVRAALDEAHSQVDQYVEEQIERMREER